MNSFDKSITILGSVFFIMFFGFLITLTLSDAYQNSPTNFTTSHYLELTADNETRDSLYYISEVSNIQCENNILNLTLSHQREMYELRMFYNHT